MTQRTLSHVDAQGATRMVDVSDKKATERMAVAAGSISMTADAYNAIMEGKTPKGPVLETARIAGIQAAKNTADWIPLCHPLPLTHISVSFAPDVKSHRIDVEASVRTHARTGVEMEALCAVSAACLTIYDMAKAMDPAMRIDEVRLLHKSGGKSGTFRRDDADASKR